MSQDFDSGEPVMTKQSAIILSPFIRMPLKRIPGRGSVQRAGEAEVAICRIFAELRLPMPHSKALRHTAFPDRRSPKTRPPRCRVQLNKHVARAGESHCDELDGRGLAVADRHIRAALTGLYE